MSLLNSACRSLPGRVANPFFEFCFCLSLTTSKHCVSHSLSAAAERVRWREFGSNNAAPCRSFRDILCIITMARGISTKGKSRRFEQSNHENAEIVSAHRSKTATSAASAFRYRNGNQKHDLRKKGAPTAKRQISPVARFWMT